MKAFNADGKQIVDYKIKDYADGSGRLEVYYYGADGRRYGAVDEKRVNLTTHRKESRKQLIARLCDCLGIAE